MTIRKRALKNGDFAYQVSIGLPPTEPGGKWGLYQKQLKTLALAKAHHKEKVAELDKGVDIKTSSATTVAELLDLFYAEKDELYTAQRKTDPAAGARTLANYRHAFAYAKATMGDVKLDKLKTSLPVDALRHAMLVDAGLKARTVRGYLRMFSWALSWGVGKGLLARNVAKESKLPPLDTDEEFVLPGHAAMIMAVTRFGMAKPGRGVLVGDGLLYEVLARTLAKTGLRLGEAQDLRWEHIDPEALALRVVDGKTQKARRTVSIESEDLEVLERLRDREAIGGGWVFVRDNGKRPGRRSISTRMQRVGEALGFRFYAHLLRHYHASVCLEVGMDFKALQERLGHESISTTMDVYGHLRQDHDRDAASRAGALLRSAGW